MSRKEMSSLHMENDGRMVGAWAAKLVSRARCLARSSSMIHAIY